MSEHDSSKQPDLKPSASAAELVPASAPPSSGKPPQVISARSNLRPPSDPPDSVPMSAPMAPAYWTVSGVALGLLKTLRPHQWVKNVFVLAPVVFAKEVFVPSLLLKAFGAFGVFCLLAGAVYTMNDLVDYREDRQHPAKRFRPIPSGQVPRRAAVIATVLLVLLALGGAALGPVSFLIAAASYFVVNVGYSFGLKHVPYLDVSLISLGFVLRVLAGGYATHTPVSMYIIACTAVLALFLGFGKRRHELATAEERKRRGKKQRPVLENYSKWGLDLALALTALSTIATYVVYSLDRQTQEYFQSDHLWMTTAFVVLGVGRFLFLVRNRPNAESPTQEMLKDGPFVGVVLVWVMVVMWIVYNLQPAS